MASSSAVTPSGSTASDQVDRLASLLLQHTNTFLISQTQSILGPLGALEEVPNDTLDPARQRRIHRKSRAGCMNCRKRRVKVRLTHTPDLAGLSHIIIPAAMSIH